MVPGYEGIIQKYRPAGYELTRESLGGDDGLTQFVRSVTIDKSLAGRDALFVALHEFGHVHLGHMQKVECRNEAIPPWVHEYEADQYAIRIMQNEGIAIPRDRLSSQKGAIRDCILEYGGSETPDDAVLKYAFGRDWRKHRP